MQAVQEGNLFLRIKIASVDQGYTGDTAATEAGEYGVELHVVKLRNSVALCCCRAAGQLSAPGWAGLLAWRLARAYEKLPQTLAGLHYGVAMLDAAAPALCVIGMDSEHARR